MAKRAFVVGFQRQGLAYTNNDVALMEECLKEHNYAVTTPQGDTKGDLKNSFDQFLDNTLQSDTLIFYFSGHGIVEGGKLYLVLGEDSARSGSRLPVSEIVNDIESGNGLNKLLILDCCKAGRAASTLPLGSSDRYWLLTASDSLSDSKELDELKASFLTYKIHEALTNQAARQKIAGETNTITLTSLHRWLRNQISEHNTTHPDDLKVPEPRLFGNPGNDFVIANDQPRENNSTPLLDNMNSDVDLLSTYIKGLIEHNRLPALTYKREKYGPPDATDIYVDLSAYNERISPEEKELLETTAGQIDSDRTVSDLYQVFAQNYAQLPPENLPDSEHKKLTALYSQHQALILLGDPGSGKTTFLKYITQLFAQNIQSNLVQFLSAAFTSHDTDFDRPRDQQLSDILLPIRIPIRYYADRRKTKSLLSLADYLPLHFMPGESDKDRLPELADLLARLLKSGSCVVLLDGLDEVTRDDDRLAITEEISKFLGEHKQYPGNRFLITSRIPGYRYVQSVLAPDCKAFTIAPMNDQEVQEFIRKRSDIIERRVNPTASSSIIERITEARIHGIVEKRRLDHAVRTMTSNPLLCGLIVSMYPDIPPTRGELYAKAVETLLSDWPRERQTALTLQKKQYEAILRDLGYWIHEKFEKRYVDLAHIKARFEKQLDEEIYKGITASADALLKDFLDTSRQTGVLEERGGGLYGFPHLGFEEYFAAKWILDWGTDEAITKVLDLLHQPRWREVTLMAISMAPSMVTDAWLYAIWQRPTPFDQVLHRNLLFIADCVYEGAAAGNRLKQEILIELIALYCDYDKRGRFKLLREQAREAIEKLARVLPVATVTSAFHVLSKRFESSHKHILRQEVIPLVLSSLKEARGTLSEDERSELHNEAIGYLQLNQKHTVSTDTLDVSQDVNQIKLLFGALWILDSTRPRWRNALQLLFDIQEENEREFERRMREFGFPNLYLSNSEINRQTHNLSALCEEIGQGLMRSFRYGWTVYENIRQVASTLLSIDETSDDSQLQDNVEEAARKIEQDLILLLDRTNDYERYSEAATILLALNDGFLHRRVLEILIEDLKERKRVKYALEVLRNHAQIVATDLDVYMTVLQYLSEEANEDSFAALDLLFQVPIKAPLVGWCWNTLRNPEHHLYGTVNKYLSRAASVERTTEVLQLLTVGLNSTATRPYVSHLFQSIGSWRNDLGEISPYLVELVFVDIAELRILAAVRLAQFAIEKGLADPVPSILQSQAVTSASLLANRSRDVKGYLSQPDVKEWLVSELALCGLTTESSVEHVKEALAASDHKLSITAVAIFLAEYHDLSSEILKALIEGLSIENDFIRQSAQKALLGYCQLLPTDGSTQAMQLFYNEYFAANENKNGYLATVFTGVRFWYSFTYWPEKWFLDLASLDKRIRLVAELSIGHVTKIKNQNVMDMLIARATTASWPQKMRLASVGALCNVIEYRAISADFLDQTAQALEQCLGDSDGHIRALAASGLRKSDGHMLDSHIKLLFQHTGPQETDDLVRFYAMKSLGSLLWKYQNTFGSDHELAQQIEDELKTNVYESSTPMIWKGAAIALAKAYHADDKRIEELLSLLQFDASHVLEVLLLANSENDVWIYQSGNSPTEEDKYYEWELNQILSWIRGQGRTKIRPLVDCLLDILDREAQAICRPNDNADDDDALNHPFSGWPLRRFATIVLAELTDQVALAPSVLARSRSREDVRSILIAIGRDPDSFNVRRFAIRLLSEFQELNAEVAQVLFAGYKDTDVVNKDSYDAALKFKEVTPESFDYLVSQLESASLLCSSSAAMFLGRLGASIAQRDPTTRDKIADKLFRILNEGPNSAAHALRSKAQSEDGTFDDIVFESLLNIVSGPDFNRWIPASVSRGVLEALARNQDLSRVRQDINEVLTGSEPLLRDRPRLPSPLTALGNLDELRRQATQMQNSLDNREIHLRDANIEIVVTGSQEFKWVLFSGKSDDKLVNCLNKAIKASQEAAARKLQSMTAGLGNLLTGSEHSDGSVASNPLEALGNLNSLRLQAKRMQDELANEQILVEEDDISIIITGDQRLISVVVAGDPYAQLIPIANDAIKQSQQLAATLLQDMTGGLSNILNTARANVNPVEETPVDSQNIDDQNIFEMLGLAESSAEDKESFLATLQDVLWTDFLTNDAELLLTDDEMTELQRILGESGPLLEDQEQVVVYLEKLIPDLQDLLLEKAVELKKQIFLERVKGLKEALEEQGKQVTLIEHAENLVSQGRWRDATNVVNSLSSLTNVSAADFRALG